MAEISRKERPRDPVWAREPGQRRPMLSRDAIVDAAIEIADSEDLEAVSIRRVAAKLGARTMSLYTYIDSKEDLLHLMANQVAGEFLIEGEMPADWREAISEIARRSRECLLRHPWLPALVHQNPAPGPNHLRHVEQSLAAVSSLTTDPASMVRIVAAVDHYMLGYVMHAPHLEREGEPHTAPEALQHPYFQKLLQSGDFQHLKTVLRAGAHSEESFEAGLSWLLDGIERNFAPRDR